MTYTDDPARDWERECYYRDMMSEQADAEPVPAARLQPRGNAHDERTITDADCPF